MTLSRNTIDKIRAATGADTVPGRRTTFNDDGTVSQEGTVPYGYTLVGAINKLERIAENMDEYDITFADLPTKKQTEFEEAHEALQYHVSNLSNEFADNVVGQDDGIELPNGKTVDFPKQVMSGKNSKDLPDSPGNSGSN